MSEFKWPLRVYIEDTDAGGIVYYVNYLKYMERARTEFLRQLGYDKTFIFNTELMFVVKQVNCDYQAPAKLDDELTITAKPLKIAASYIELEQNVFCKNELLCSGVVKIVCVTKTGLKPTKIPQPMRESLQAASKN